MARSDIIKEFEIIDLGLWIPEQKILAFSDFHIGYDEYLNKRGVFIPRHQLLDTLDRLRKIFIELEQKPETIVICGDLKHEFGTVNREEFFGVRDLLKLLLKNCKKVIITKGNHDTILDYAKTENVKIVPYFYVDGILFAHGDSIIQNPNSAKAKTIIIGHSHPTLKLTDEMISEKVKCFLKGKWKGKNVIALPSFNLVTEGANAIAEHGFSPYSDNMKDAEAWAVPSFNDILYFGKIKNIEKFTV
jgi:putative SbcD/Mre11-related phosphoesterase